MHIYIHIYTHRIHCLFRIASRQYSRTRRGGVGIGALFRGFQSTVRSVIITDMLI